MNDQHLPSDVAELSELALSTSDDRTKRTLSPAIESVIVVLCVAIPVCVWVLIINWSTRYVRQDLEKHERPEVKPIEIRQFDIDSWRKTVGTSED